MPRQEVVKFRFSSGYASDLSITGASDYMRQGSQNALVTGAGLVVPFKGLTKIEPELIGSRQNFLTDDSFAGLGDYDTQGQGSIFRAIDLLFFMGEGELSVKGIAIEDGSNNRISAGTNLQYLKRDSGEFDNGDADHLFEVGHARPSAPLVYSKNPIGPNQKPMNATVAVAIWRADSMTGQPSLPSEATTITLTNSSVIVTFPLPDTNGQDVWGIGGTLLGVQIGNIYQIPTERGGEVLESTLSYTRTVTATVTNGDATVVLDPGTPSADRFSSSDVGRRIVRGADLDSWITSVTDAFTAECFDQATGSSTGSATITHAVDGYERAVEISWSDDDLLANATFAPYHAFPPMDGRFAGVILDTFFIEDLEGTIFYSIPNFLSFPRAKRRIFTEDKATVYVDTGRGYQWRIAPQTISQLYYVPGDVPIRLDIKTKNIGCKYPSNACLGYDGRLLVWGGRPLLVGNDGSFNSTLHSMVETEFDGWEDQTEDEPVVVGFDGIGQYELWCKGNKIMAMHAPTGRWCAPLYIDEWTDGTIVGTVIVDEKLRLVVREGTELNHYEWNTGSGSTLIVESYHRQLPGMTTISTVDSVVRRGSTDLEFTYEVIKDFKDEIVIGTDPVLASDTEHQCATSFRPNIRGAGILGVRVTVPNADARCAVDYIDVYGEWNQSWSDPRA